VINFCDEVKVEIIPVASLTTTTLEEPATTETTQAKTASFCLVALLADLL